MSANGGSAPRKRFPRTRLRAHQVSGRHQGLHCRSHRRWYRRNGQHPASQAARARRAAGVVHRIRGTAVDSKAAGCRACNLTAATQLFDGRFGIMANITYDHVLTRQDYLRNTEWVRLGDWDDSPEKTIESLNGAYAAVATEAGGRLHGIHGRADQNNCRQQWWDYSPRIPRYGIWLRDDKRTAGAADTAISRSATSRCSGSKGRTPSASSSSTTTTTAPTSRRRDRVRTRRPTSTTACLPPHPIVTVDRPSHHGLDTIANQTTSSASGGTNGSFGTSARGFDLDNTTDYLSTGYEYNGERLQAKLGWSEVDSSRDDETNSANFTARVSGFGVQLDEKGVPRFNFPAGFSMEDDDAYYTTQLQYRPSENELKERQAIRWTSTSTRTAVHLDLRSRHPDAQDDLGTVQRRRLLRPRQQRQHSRTSTST